jgi:hypothetical protein
MSKVLEFPTLLKDAFQYLESHKDQTKDIVCFIRHVDGEVNFLSTGHDIELLYLISKRIEAEMNSILADKYIMDDEEDYD